MINDLIHIGVIIIGVIIILRILCAAGGWIIEKIFN
jgi:hypothetical protein